MPAGREPGSMGPHAPVTGDSNESTVRAVGTDGSSKQQKSPEPQWSGGFPDAQSVMRVVSVVLLGDPATTHHDQRECSGSDETRSDHAYRHKCDGIRTCIWQVR